MGHLHICKKCRIEFRTGPNFIYCPFCGEKTTYIGAIIGTTDEAEKKWREASKILYRRI